MTAPDPYLPPPKRPLGRVDPSPEAQAEYVTGLLVAARAAREKAAHEAYNDPVALAGRIEAELAAPDPEPEPVKPHRGKRPSQGR
jgi:hypothetical protein